MKIYVKNRIKDFEYLFETGNFLKNKIDSILARGKLSYGICHGDLHFENIKVSENGQFTILDFDCCGTGYRAYDLSVNLWFQITSSIVNQTGTLNKELIQNYEIKKKWELLLQSYKSVTELSELDIEAINIFVAIRHIWLLGAHIGCVQRNIGYQMIDGDYFDFHLDFIKTWVNSF